MNISEQRINELGEFEKLLGYEFMDKSLLNQAFIHSSYANENEKFKNYFNERLEFLGDAVLELVFTEILYKNFSHKDEGYLTKLRSKLVCEKSFSCIADELHLSKYLLLGKGEEATGGRDRSSIKADTFEALSGAIYLDSGYKSIYSLVEENFNHIVQDQRTNHNGFVDYKSRLQEYLHKNKIYEFKYILCKEEGLPHDKTFYIDVYVNSRKISSGKGKNKKEAEQSAAKKALEFYGVLHD